MTLDHAVAQAVARSRVLEAALHSPEPWFIEIGGLRELTSPVRHANGVRFRACFFEPVEADSVTLYEGAIPRMSRPYSAPADGPFCVDWDISLGERVSA